MGNTRVLTVTPIFDPDGYVELQTPSGAGNLVLDGDLVTNGVGRVDDAHRVFFTSGSNYSALTFTIKGTDSRDVVISESILGPNAASVITTKYFKTVTSISIDGAGPGTIDIGVFVEACTKWFLFNHGNHINLGVEIKRANTTDSINYTLEHTSDDINKNEDLEIKTFPHEFIQNIVNQEIDGNYSYPARAGRVIVNSALGNTLTVTITQAF